MKLAHLVLGAGNEGNALEAFAAAALPGGCYIAGKFLSAVDEG